MFSGRGIAIPVGGAVDGSGDGSKYLGRPRRPLSMDAAGSPSMHADSGFASIDAMARVNKGYTDIFTSKPMFPEQEVSEEEQSRPPARARALLVTVKAPGRRRVR